MNSQTERCCPKCDRPVKTFDRLKGGQCIACNQSARLGENDDERRVVAPALAIEASAPAPSSPEPVEVPPAAVRVIAWPCAKCDRTINVHRNGPYMGYCAGCVESARTRCKRMGSSPTPTNITEILTLDVESKSPGSQRRAALDVSFPDIQYRVPAWVFELCRAIRAPRLILTERFILTSGALSEYCADVDAA